MNWWGSKPLMQRSLRDDVTSAVAVWLGGGLAWLVFGADDPGILVAGAAGAVIGLAGMGAVRRAKRKGRSRAALRRVGDPGFEPGTSSLSEKRSNRLS